MNAKNPSPALPLPQQQALARIRRHAWPDRLTVKECAWLLASEPEQRKPWLWTLEGAIKRGELDTVTETAPAEPPPPWYAQNRPMAATLRRPAQGTPPRTVVTIAVAELRRWLSATGSGALVDMLPAPAPDAAPATPTTTGPRTRTDRLNVAIKAALAVLTLKLKRSPTVPELFAYLAEHDDTGIIEDANATFLFWTNSKGGTSRTSLKSLYSRLPKPA
jgi:hypothetical protein